MSSQHAPTPWALTCYCCCSAYSGQLLPCLLQSSPLLSTQLLLFCQLLRGLFCSRARSRHLLCCLSGFGLQHRQLLIACCRPNRSLHTKATQSPGFNRRGTAILNSCYLAKR
jgi:hypothetical protein